MSFTLHLTVGRNRDEKFNKTKRAAKFKINSLTLGESHSRLNHIYENQVSPN